MFCTRSRLQHFWYWNPATDSGTPRSQSAFAVQGLHNLAELAPMGKVEAASTRTRFGKMWMACEKHPFQTGSSGLCSLLNWTVLQASCTCGKHRHSSDRSETVLGFIIGTRPHDALSASSVLDEIRPHVPVPLRLALKCLNKTHLYHFIFDTNT